MENLAVIAALYHSDSFRNHLLGFLEKKENVIHQPRSVRIGKNCALYLVSTKTVMALNMRSDWLLNIQIFSAIHL